MESITISHRKPASPLRQTIKILTVTIALATAAGCASQQEREALAEIDQQLATAQDYFDRYTRLPIDSLMDRRAAKLPVYSTLLADTTLPLADDERATLGAITRHFEGIADLIPIAEKTAVGLHYVISQYTNLATDIRQGLIPADSLRHYLDREASSLALMRKDILTVLQFETMAERHRELELKADSIVRKLYDQHQQQARP